MDTTKAVTHVSICAGYGGIDLGLKRAIPNLRTIAFSEIEAFACANLVAKMEAGLLDAAPIWTNLKTFPWDSFRGKVDILSGGYPCQPFSAAGKRQGADDPRHLWPYIADGIIRMRPRVCFFENVEGHISLGLPDVIEDLAGMGYRTTWGIFSASEVGAPHQRKRVFILAYRKGDEWGQPEAGNWGEMLAGGSAEAWPSRPGEPQHGWEPPRVVENSERGRGEEPEHQHANLPSEPSGGYAEASVGNALLAGSSPEWSSRGQQDGLGEPSDGAMGHPNSPRPQERPRHRGAGIQGADADGGADAGGQTQSPLGRDADGSADWLDDSELYTTCDNRTDELRLLGNGVVPATAERAFKILTKELYND